MTESLLNTSVAGKQLGTEIRPVDQRDLIELRLAVEAFGELKKLSKLDALKLFKELCDTASRQHQRYDAKLSELSKSIIPPHASWRSLAHYLAALDRALDSRGTW